MNHIILTSREKRLLFVMRFRKKVKPKFDVSELVRHGLICRNYTGKFNIIGEAISEDTYSLTELDTRRRIAIRKDRFERIVTPIFVSVASSVITAAVTAIITVLLMEK